MQMFCWGIRKKGRPEGRPVAVSPFTAGVIKKQNHIDGDYNVSAAFLCHRSIRRRQQPMKRAVVAATAAMRVAAFMMMSQGNGLRREGFTAR